MTPIRLLHGFTQTCASFGPFRDALADLGIESDTLPLPGHETGTGPERLVTADLWTGADELAHSTTPGVWLGYSMGARLALHLVLAHPEAVTGLILIGGTAGIDDDDERKARRTHDEALASHLETVGIEVFLDEWLANSMFVDLPPDPDRKRRRATNSAAGLASSLRRWGTGTMDPPLWDRLAEITVPTLVLAGSRDAKFTALGERCAISIGANARFSAIPDAGHAAHIEQPAATARIVEDWLSALDHH